MLEPTESCTEDAQGFAPEVEDEDAPALLVRFPVTKVVIAKYLENLVSIDCTGGVDDRSGLRFSCWSSSRNHWQGYLASRKVSVSLRSCRHLEMV